MATSNRTKAAILRAMDAATTEGEDFAWGVLDLLFSAMVTGQTAGLYAQIDDGHTDWEAGREQSPENVTSNADMVYAAGEPLPACSTPATGRRS